MHESDIYRRATKTESAEFEKEQGDFSQTFRSSGMAFCFDGTVFSTHVLLLGRDGLHPSFDPVIRVSLSS